MKKKWAVMIVIILLIVGLCVFESIYIQNSFTYLYGELVKFEEKISEDENNIGSEENVAIIKDLHSSWQRRSDNLKMIVWHTGMKEVEINLSRIQSYVITNNFEEAIVELNALKDFCLHYKDDFIITIENIL
ncbi:MAG: DUF4363 family protein [bacterium]|nr:DUF4363 family protein [bacterium]